MTLKLPQLSPAKRLYLIFIAIIGLLLAGLVAGAYGTSVLLSSRANSLTGLKAKSLALTQEQASLTKAKKDIHTYANLAKIAQSVVPEDKDQAEAVREIVNIAAANNISLAAINFPASTLGTLGPTTSVGAAPAAPATSSSSAGANTKTSKLSQLLPVKNIPGVYDLQIVVQGDPNKPIQYTTFVSFLTALEHNRRTAQISAITLSPSSTNHNLLTFSLTLNEYIKP